MPKYISPLGTSCTADEAKTGGRLRFGYQEILSDGDRINFDITMCDAGAPRSSTFLTDSSASASLRAAIDREQAAHDHKFAFMGDRAPEFDRERAELIARTTLAADKRTQLKGASLSVRSSGPVAKAHLASLSDQSETENTRTPAVSSRDAGRHMRGMVRLARNAAGC